MCIQYEGYKHDEYFPRDSPVVVVSEHVEVSGVLLIPVVAGFHRFDWLDIVCFFQFLPCMYYFLASTLRKCAKINEISAVLNWIFGFDTAEMCKKK